MKLPQVSRGPVTLRAINYAPNLSRETLAFTATLAIDDTGECRVENDGGGGENRVHSHAAKLALGRYCSTLPAHDCDSVSLPMTPDLLISLMVGEALQRHDDARQKRKGFQVRASWGQLVVYGLDEQQCRKALVKHGAPPDRIVAVTL